MIQDSKRSLPPEALARIARLELKAKEVVEGFLSGLHRSPYFGQSIEFVQHREYVAGDDVRRVDWKVWSKTDKYYIKLYEEETNLRTSILVDASESMQFGSGELTKFDFGCVMAAAMAYLLLRQQDAVSVATFDQAIRTLVPSRSRSSHLQLVLSTLIAEQAAKRTDIYETLRRVADDKAQRGVVVLISDLFVDREQFAKGLRLLKFRGHEVIVFHVMDDQELEFNYSGTTKFEGLEQAGELICDPRALRESYLGAVQEYLEEIRRICGKQMVDYRLVRPSQRIDAILAHLAHARQAQARQYL